MRKYKEFPLNPQYSLTKRESYMPMETMEETEP